MKLHEMSKDYIGFLESDLTGDDLTECLDSIEDAIDEKASNIVKLVASLDVDVSGLDTEIKRLQARKKSVTNNQERLREYLRYNMEMTGITKIKHTLFNITLGKPTVTAEIVDIDFLPDNYVNTEVVIKADKKAILKALKDGEDIPGAVLSTGKSRLLIK
mgnify:CR=1 FL=1|tara:strand:+ start:862 stop:1341 length:480 start_codon:yes stop_codon:yes gene_type:complete